MQRSIKTLGVVGLCVLLLRAGDAPAASALLRSGIAAAQAQSNLHAAEEMSALLAQIEV